MRAAFRGEHRRVETADLPYSFYGVGFQLMQRAFLALFVGRWISVLEVVINTACRLPPSGQGLGYRGWPGDSIATGENASSVGGESNWVNLNSAAFAEADTEAPSILGRLADSRDQGIVSAVELATFDGHWLTPAPFVRFAELHADAGHQQAAVLPLDSSRRCQKLDVYSFFQGLLHFDLVRGHLCPAAPVEDLHLLRPESQGGAGCIDGYVSSSYHSNLPAQGGPKSQVDLSEEGGPINHPGDIAAGYSHAEALVCSNGQEDSLVAHLKEQVQRYHSSVCPDFDAYLGQPLDFGVDYVSGKAVLGNADTQHASQLGMGFENGSRVAALSQIVGAGQACRTGADYGDLLGAIGFRVGLDHPVATELDGKPLQCPDSDGVVHLATPAGLLAGMRTDMGADGGKGVAIPDNLECLHDPTLGGQVNVFPDVHM